MSTSEWKFIRYQHGDGSPDWFTPEMFHLAERASGLPCDGLLCF